MTGWIERAMPHLIVAPIVLPLVAAALMVALGEQRRVARALVNVLASSAGLAVAVALALWVDGKGAPEAFGVYLPGEGTAPPASLVKQFDATAEEIRALPSICSKPAAAAGATDGGLADHRVSRHSTSTRSPANRIKATSAAITTVPTTPIAAPICAV